MIENYDLGGNLVSQQTVSTIGGTAQAFRPVTKYVYDQLNRRKQTEVWNDENASSGTIMLKEEYDFTGRRTRQYDADAITTRYDYDGRGQLKQVVLAEGTVDATFTSYAYDEWGNQLVQTDGNSHTTRFEYDVLGRRNKRTLPGTASERGPMIIRTEV
jgi:YD repeat-containing protein